jgi:hypothetical protein
LYDIINEYLDQLPHESTSIYIAPNGKQYLVEFNTDRYAYTSPDFTYVKYFPTRELFTKHIDLNNPGSYHSSNSSSNTTSTNSSNSE